MARTNNLGNFLTDVADAIREKTGGTAQISAKDFDTEIRSIEGGGSGGVKLFSTISDMNNDSNKQENDLAVVYGDSFTGVQLESEFSIVKFPYQVTLSSAMTEEASRYV